ncbi:hypothetical protein G9A89_020158 [Geosiphon pyriformis]|nr:hypothetical protein G9A89_020158 [Geosiphon pyriformis]
MVKKTRSSEKWGQLLASAIVTPNLFVVSNEILDKISIALSGTSSKMDQDQLLAVLPNVVSSGKSSLVVEAKQSLPVGSSVLGNWTDQIETDLSPSLVTGATSGDAWKTITSCQRFAEWVASTLVPGATFKIKLVHVKSIFQSSLKAVFLVKLTSSVHLATLKIAKSLVVSESGSLPAAVVLCDVPLVVSAADVKCQEMGHLVVDCKISPPPTPKVHKVFKSHFVNGVSYAKASAFLDSSEFPPLVASISSSMVVGDSLVSFWLASLESDLVKLSTLVESIVKPVGSLVKLFEQFINGDLVSSSKLGLKVNKVMVHMGSFSKIVGKLGREVVSLKKECCMEDINMSGDSEHPVGLNDDPIDVKADVLKTAEWLVGLVLYSATLFLVIQKMSFLGKFSSGAST